MCCDCMCTDMRLFVGSNDRDKLLVRCQCGNGKCMNVGSLSCHKISCGCSILSIQLQDVTFQQFLCWKYHQNKVHE